MNRAAGDWPLRTLRDGRRLSAGAGAAGLGRRCGHRRAAWRHFADAFQRYPLSTRFQWWGRCTRRPSGAALEARAQAPAAHLAGGGPCGDAIGEALDNHTLAEAVILARQMSEEWDKGVSLLKPLERGFRDTASVCSHRLTEAIASNSRAPTTC